MNGRLRLPPLTAFAHLAYISNKERKGKKEKEISMQHSNHHSKNQKRQRFGANGTIFIPIQNTASANNNPCYQWNARSSVSIPTSRIEPLLLNTNNNDKCSGSAPNSAAVSFAPRHCTHIKEEKPTRPPLKQTAKNMVTTNCINIVGTIIDG
jgi:hypothetical protein